MNLRVTEKESQIINQKNIKISKMVKMNILKRISWCFYINNFIRSVSEKQTNEI